MRRLVAPSLAELVPENCDYNQTAQNTPREVIPLEGRALFRTEAGDGGVGSTPAGQQRGGRRLIYGGGSGGKSGRPL